MKKIFPTELIDFLQCRHIITLKKAGVRREEIQSEELEFLKNKGLEHEKDFLDSLSSVVEIDLDAPIEVQKEQTLEAINEGADYIYQAYLESDELAGYPDFLEKDSEAGQSDKAVYRILDAKLSNIPSAANAVQLLHYKTILSEIQNDFPPHRPS